MSFPRAFSQTSSRTTSVFGDGLSTRRTWRSSSSFSSPRLPSSSAIRVHSLREPLPLPLPGVKPNGERSAEDSAHHHLPRGGAEDQGHRRHQLPLRLHGGRQRLKDDFNEIRISRYATIDQKVVFRLINVYTNFTNNALIRFN